VVQGQVIATLGNSGKTTGPHLHYEVHLGTSLIDPLRFLNIRKAVRQ
jgi:murein DD-endopeptidase MepM/ murein hydrolase activator NlpD